MNGSKPPTELIRSKRVAPGRLAGCGMVLGCLLLTGCGTVVRFTGGNGEGHIFYEATRTDIDGIRNLTQPPPHVDFSLVPSWLLLPFPVIDLPFAVVLDTVLLPYDAYRYRKARKMDAFALAQARFWEDAFDRDAITTADALRNLTLPTGEQVLRALEAGRGGTNVTGVLLELAVAQNRPDVVVALSKHPRLAPDHCRRILIWSQAAGQSEGEVAYIPFHLARNPAAPSDMLTAFVTSSDELLCWAVLESGHLPLAAIRAALAQSPPDWFSSKLRAATDPSTSPNTLTAWAQNTRFDGLGIQAAVATNTNTPADGLRRLAASEFHEVRAAVAANPATPVEVLQTLSKDKAEVVRAAALKNLETR